MKVSVMPTGSVLALIGIFPFLKCSEDKVSPPWIIHCTLPKSHFTDNWAKGHSEVEACSLLSGLKTSAHSLHRTALRGVDLRPQPAS